MQVERFPNTLNPTKTPSDTLNTKNLGTFFMGLNVTHT